MKTLAHPRDKEEIGRRLLTVRADSSRRWGRMSAHQMVCHLADCFRMAHGAKEVRRADSLLGRTVAKWFALYLPWPGGRIRTSPEIDQEGDGTRPTDFASDIAAVIALMDTITAPGGALQGRIHPTFGRLSEVEWLRWAYRHTDHHLRQFGC